MTENFSDAKSIKQKRANFMGNVKEVSAAPPVAAKTVAPTSKPIVEVETGPSQPLETVKPEEKTTLKKGFVVGHTDDGIVKLQPFGGLSELELVGLIEYARAKSTDMIGRIARTSMSDIKPIKEGVTILAQSIKALLTQDKKANS